MIYDGSDAPYPDGVWHCPFSEEWVEMMKKAVSHCQLHKVMVDEYEPFYEFLSEPQDARGLPLSYCIEEEKRFNKQPIPRAAIYDYCTIPEVVATNGDYDWPVRFWEKLETL